MRIENNIQIETRSEGINQKKKKNVILFEMILRLYRNQMEDQTAQRVHKSVNKNAPQIIIIIMYSILEETVSENGARKKQQQKTKNKKKKKKKNENEPELKTAKR